jgi:MFS transporter, DHA2 family, multidrug resistance protein
LPQNHAEDVSAGRSIQRRTLLVGVAAALGVTGDTAGFGATLGTLDEKLQMSSFESTFVVSAYALAAAAALIVGGSLSDRYGHRRLIGVGTIVAFFALLLAAAAPNGWIMAISRAASGAAGALITVSTLAAIAEVFVKADRTRAYSYLTVSAAIAYMLAPLAAGYLIEQPIWRLTPLFAVPMCVVMLAILRLMPDQRRDPATSTRNRLDWPGFVLAILTTLFLFTTVSIFTRSGPGVVGITALSVSIGLLVFFVAWEVRVGRETKRQPVLDMRLFKNRNFGAVVSASVLGSFGTGAAFLLVAYLALFVLEMSAFETGLVLVPASLAGIGAALMCPYVERRLGMGHTIAVGFGIACAAYIAMATIFESNLWAAFVAIAVLSFAGNFNRPSINSATVAAVKSGEQAVALGTAATVTRLASTISLAIVTGVFASRYAEGLHSTLVLTDLDQKAHAVEQQSLAAIVEVENALGGHGAPQAAAFDDAVAQAFLSALHVCMGVGAVTALAAAVIAWRMIGPGEAAKHRRRLAVQPEPLPRAEMLPRPRPLRPPRQTPG